MTIILPPSQALLQISSVFLQFLMSVPAPPLTEAGPGARRPSHLDPGAVEMQHLGSGCLYAAHDLFLMAHQRDPQAHHILD